MREKARDVQWRRARRGKAGLGLKCRGYYCSAGVSPAPKGVQIVPNQQEGPLCSDYTKEE